MKTTNFLGLVGAEPGDDKTCPSVAGATAHFKKVFSVFDERADADPRRLNVARTILRLELEVAVVVIPLRLPRGELRSRCSSCERRRVRVRSGALSSRRKRITNTGDA